MFPFSLAALCLLVLKAGAVSLAVDPYWNPDRAYDNSKTYGVSPQVLSDLSLYSEWAAAAYCHVQSNVRPGQRIKCGSSHVCPTLERRNATVFQSHYWWTTGVGVVIGIDEVDETIVLAFRGTINIRNWIVNLRIILRKADDLCPGCEAHEGYLVTWMEMQERVEWALRDALVQHPGFRVVTAGHSLGGALAHLAAAYLRQDLPILRTAFPAAAASNRRSLQPTGLYPASKLPYQRRAVAAEGPEAVDVYSYGAPRFANCALSRFVSDPYRSPGNDVRVTHTDDPVPHLPPALLGFRHTGVEMWLASGPSRGVRFKTSDVQICRGPLNMACNGGTFGIDFDAHRYYFRRVGACGGWGWGWRSRRHARDGSRMGTAVADKTRNETAGGYYDGYLFSAAVVAAENAEMSKLNGFTATDLTPAARKELEDKVQADIAFAVEFMTTDSC